MIKLEWSNLDQEFLLVVPIEMADCACKHVLGMPGKR